MRSRFDDQLEQLHKDLTKMGSLCEEAIAFAADALKTKSAKTATLVKPVDSEIDKMEREIESLCMNMLLRQQPVAKDLRQISAALKMITDMERIGDQADDIAEIVKYIDGKSDIDLSLIDKMAAESSEMVTTAIEAYISQDLEQVFKTIAHDDIVDELFDKMKNSMIAEIVKDPTEGEYAIDLLMVAKYFERIADHATNIAGWVAFSITGTHGGSKAEAKDA